VCITQHFTLVSHFNTKVGGLTFQAPKEAVGASSLTSLSSFRNSGNSLSHRNILNAGRASARVSGYTSNRLYLDQDIHDADVAESQFFTAGGNFSGIRYVTSLVVRRTHFLLIIKQINQFLMDTMCDVSFKNSFLPSGLRGISSMAAAAAVVVPQAVSLEQMAR
jgi:hypothetical protein